jgi:hypothetical protein
MPPVTRWFIKAGLFYFAIAMLMATLVAGQQTLALPAGVNALYPVYLHLLMVGWVTQLIFGVVYWMFPKHSKEHPRGSARLGWAVFILLNAGLILRAFGEPLIALAPQTNAGWLLAVSAIMQLLAGWGFIANTWTRVKER